MDAGSAGDLTEEYGLLFFTAEIPLIVLANVFSFFSIVEILFF